MDGCILFLDDELSFSVTCKTWLTSVVSDGPGGSGSGIIRMENRTVSALAGSVRIPASFSADPSARHPRSVDRVLQPYVRTCSRGLGPHIPSIPPARRTFDNGGHTCIPPPSPYPFSEDDEDMMYEDDILGRISL